MISDTKDKILRRAARLFFTEGFATGIDRVVSECDVAKMTLYQHFKTKEGLICAILDESHAILENHIRVETALNKKAPLAQLEAASLILCQAMNDQDARLGLAVRALIEFPDPRNAVHDKARQFDLAILKLFERLAEEASLPDPKQVAREILQVAKGHFLMAPTVGVEQSQTITLALLSPVLAKAIEVRQSGAVRVRRPKSTVRPPVPINENENHCP